MPRTRARATLAEDFAAARVAIPVLADRAAALVAGVADPKAPSRLPPWTAGDVAIHLAQACTAYAGAAAGELAGEILQMIPEEPELRARMTELNAHALAEAEPDEYLRAPEIIRLRAKEIKAVTEGRDPLDVCQTPWFGEDVRLPLHAVVGLFLSETALHTLDIARTSRQRWRIDPSTARLIASLVFPEMMPRMYHPEVADGYTADVRLHVRGGVTIGVTARDGAIEVTRNPTAAAPRPDCHVLLDPVGFLLVASGRASRYPQIAAGRMLPYGRRPWLAPRCSRLFSYP